MARDSEARSDSGRPSPNKQLVHRLVDDVINARRFESLDGLATSRLAPKLRTAFEEFRAAFPDWHQEIVELVEEGDTVVARFRCTGTQATDWQGLTATGRAMEVDEVSFIRITDDRISGIWGLEDTWTRIRQLAGDDVTLGSSARSNPADRPTVGRGRAWRQVPGTSRCSATTSQPIGTSLPLQVQNTNFD